MNTVTNQKNVKYEWFASGNAPTLYPTLLYKGDFVFADESKLYIPISYPFAERWGEAESMHILDNSKFPAPSSIAIKWLSLIENQFYSLDAPLPQERIDGLLAQKDEATKEQKYNFIVAGMAPHGGLAIWLVGANNRTEVAWLQAEPIDVEWKDFSPTTNLNRDEYVDAYVKESKDAYVNLQKNGLPDKMLFERYMQKFNYRITPNFENEDAVFEGIELYYYNGELNTTNSGEHAENTMRAKPYKIVLNWSIGKTQYGGYFWTDEKKIIETFAKFYGSDTQKEGNLVIEVGESNNQFKFFLQDDTTVAEIPVEDMQIMVFKNKYEYFRSDNYDRLQGGWRN